MLQHGGTLPAQVAELKRQSTGQNIVMGGGSQDLSIDQLLEQLAKKGKKVKIVGDGDE